MGTSGLVFSQDTVDSLQSTLNLIGILNELTGTVMGVPAEFFQLEAYGNSFARIQRPISNTWSVVTESDILPWEET